MAILQVRDVPDELYESLSAIAREENRSISQETIILLKNALKLKTGRKAKRNFILAEIDQLKSLEKQNNLPAPEDLIREDRDR